MDRMYACLAAGLPRLGLELSHERCQKLCDFAHAMVRQNEVMNLTGITEDEAVAKLHLLDSLTVLSTADVSGKTLIDVGCGAGFPGVPLKLGEPSLRLTLLDSLGKRVDWLRQTLDELGVEAECVHARAEEFGRRESYDIAVSRAVARLNVLAELCLPFVRVGGCFLAMKGAAAQEELAEAERAVTLLGGQVERVDTYELDGALRRVAVIRKVRRTPNAYPRRFAKIKQQPL